MNGFAVWPENLHTHVFWARLHGWQHTKKAKNIGDNTQQKSFIFFGQDFLLGMWVCVYVCWCMILVNSLGNNLIPYEKS